MSNQSLEVFSAFQGCTKWNPKETPYLEGSILAFIDIKHIEGTDKMLVVNAPFKEDDRYHIKPVFLHLTEELDTSLKIQNAELGKTVIIGAEGTRPFKYNESGNLVFDYDCDKSAPDAPVCNYSALVLK